jgi:low temperature requirement protein LtrA
MPEREQRVTPIELFFDLVFVYTITQVTTLMSEDLTWRGLGRGLLVLAALWWGWTGYAWLTNMLEPEDGLARAGMFCGMAAMLVAALGVPGAFGREAVLFGVAFLLVRLCNLLLYGIAAAGLDLTAAVITAGVLGLAVIAALWWAYFDVFAVLGEQQLARTSGAGRARLARDNYSYLHMPMIAGIVLFALGLKITTHDVGEPLATLPAVALCGGLSLYYLVHVVMRIRLVAFIRHTTEERPGWIGPGRLVATLATLACIPAAVTFPALAALGLIAALCWALIVWDVLHYREHRGQIRQARH